MKSGISSYLRKLKQYTTDIRESKDLQPWSQWTMRPHQQEVFDKLNEHDRNILVWHRRAGKDILALNYILKQASERKGLYWHMFPSFVQGKNAIWHGMDSEGVKLLDALGGKRNNIGMYIDLPNGSIYQIIGSDSALDRVRGANPIGVVFSEYSYMNAGIWDVIRPILKGNKGWALFLYTPNGVYNQGFELYEMAKKNSNWYVEKKGIDDTGLLTEKDMKEERESGMVEELLQQEYFCKFLEHAYGSYYSKIIRKRRDDGYITELNIENYAPVSTYWDIGNNTSVWFVQKQGEFWCVIDYLEGKELGLEYYMLEVKRRGYAYDTHVFPHDMANKEYSSGNSRIDTARDLRATLALSGEVSIQNKMSLDEGLHITLKFLDKCKIDATRCKKGLEALIDYKRAYNEKNKFFLDYPDKNQWSAHASDAFRYAAIDCLTRDNVENSLDQEFTVEYNTSDLKL